MIDDLDYHSLNFNKLLNLNFQFPISKFPNLKLTK